MLLNPVRAAWVSSSFALASVSAVVILTGSVCLAQVTGGTISGSVRDSSASGIAGAQVAVKNSEMAILRSVDADNNGSYTAPNLVPGTYEISASKNGFQTVVRSSVVVTVGSEEVIDFKLNPGEVRTKIEVSHTACDPIGQFDFGGNRELHNGSRIASERARLDDSGTAATGSWRRVSTPARSE